MTITVGHSHLGHFLIQILESLGSSCSSPEGLEWFTASQMVESDSGGAVREHPGVFLYLLHPGQALPGLAHRRARAGLSSLGSGPLW